MTEKEYRDYIYEKAQKVTSKEDLDALLKEVVKSLIMAKLFMLCPLV